MEAGARPEGSPDGGSLRTGTSDDGGSARPGVGDVLRLVGGMARSLAGLDEERDPAAVGCRWARRLMEREDADALEIPVPGRSIRMVGERTRSRRMLSLPPDADGPPPGRLKVEAMSFLAPGALTVASGRRWRRLRDFNERVLDADGPHPFADAFLEVVRDAFAAPVRDRDDVRERMGRAMVGIVLGEIEPDADPAGDVRVLFDAVQSPVRRKLLGFLYRRRRARLFELLGRVYEVSDDGRRTLLARAREEAGELSKEEVLQQVPHWMFTFTGSGTDLLARTLAMIAARPRVHQRVGDELRRAGPLDDPAAIRRLPYVEACLRETGRLFPPVTRTFHRSEGSEREVVHYFPLLQRDPDLGPSVDAFHPERWTAPEPDAATRASYLFLGGPRACPGEELILFVCKAAVARQMEGAGFGTRTSRLSRDPLPVSFPTAELRFHAQEDA